MGDEKFESLQNYASLDCWDYTIELECLEGNQDLQLAAELGKTLLERNKELETALKQHQNVIEDQTLEIGYLTKQTTALREVNESRLRIYEQLEGSIQDLERANHRLVVENTADKKQIKSLNVTIENLEVKCDEFQNTVDDLHLQIDILKRKVAKPPEILPHKCCKYNSECTEYFELDRPKPKEPDHTDVKVSKASETQSKCRDENDSLDLELANEQLSQLMSQLRENKTLFAKEQVRVAELEDQLASVIRQNQSLEKQVNQLILKDDQSKSMHEELSSLEEFRQGQLCCRCLRTIDSTRASETLSYLDDEVEDDDDSMLNALINDPPVHRSSFTMEIEDYDKTSSSPHPQEPNLYRELVEKYEALLEVQRNQSPRKSVNNLSLQEELQMSGPFNQKNIKDTDDESGHGDSLQPEKEEKKNRKSVSRTPTDFSEAETNSSGFSDETSNKSTQTEGRFGSFLCTIADGEDCKFSIYDDNTATMDSRFGNRPEYREIFANIFQVLKKAAEHQDEGEKLPLLDDHTSTKTPVKPCATPVREERETEVPDFDDNLTDDTQSVMSSTMSEVSTNQPEPRPEKPFTKPEVSTPIHHTSNSASQAPPQPVLTPYRRQPLEYLSVGVNVRKNASSKRRKQHSKDRSDRPITPVLGPTTVTYSNRPGRRPRKEIQTKPDHVWNGATLTIYSQKKSPLAQENNKNYDNTMDYKPGTALKDLSKLKRLDLSYAEVVRNAELHKQEAALKQQLQAKPHQAQTRHRRKQ